MKTVDFSILELEDGDRVLDLGCGEGRHLHALFSAALVHAVGLDLGYEDVQKARQGFLDHPDLSPGPKSHYSLTVGNALRLPFADNSFDKIICSEVLEHIPDYQSVLSEIERILKPGGTLAVSVPRYWPEWLCWALSDDYHNEPGGHVRIFRTATLRSDIETNGFHFFKRHWAHGLHSPYWWLRCAVGVKNTENFLVKLYHRFLVWDLMDRPAFTRILEAIAAPLMGKSVVLYFRKGAAA